MSATAIKKVESPAVGLIDALIAARKEFGPVLKSKQNPHFKSHFAGLDDVLAAVDQALGNHGLALVQRTRLAEGVGMVLVTELRHVSGEVMDSEWPLVPAKDRDPQALGSALTYARRYQAMAILGIAPEDDDGEEASGRPKGNAPGPLERAFNGAMNDATGRSDGAQAVAAGVQQKADTWVSQRQIQTFYELETKLKWARPHLVNWLKKHSAPGVTSWDDMPKEEGERLLDLLLGELHKEQTVLHDMERRR